ncbi:MAG TPA: PQQ-binding-like beta-propeller repeat protein, partial [Gemmatimonadales bacterium]|nr:PQQ-binding-like beta-propeller repeat protein [Gemmatimonadales bacterium]
RAMTPMTSAGRSTHGLTLMLALLASACGDGTGPDEGGSVVFLGLQVVPETGQLYVGQYGGIAAQPYDRDHHLVTGVPISWASSDTNVVQVYSFSSGVSVLAKAPGSAIVVASSGKAEASVAFTVTVIPVGSVQVTPDTSAAYVGLTATLSAVVIDTFGGTLTDRPVTWSSTNAGRASVDANGAVTAHSAGDVTIIATREGKADSASLTVLARPAADWSAVTEEWVTFQGGAAHTGYVPATVDPVVFTKLWQTPSVQSGFGFNQAVVGGGRILMSSNAYFGTQRLLALDAATGAELWSHEFGTIHSVDPPGYADGTVYVATGGHEESFLWAFDAATGSERFHTAYGNQWSRWEAPVISGGNVYMAGGYFGGMYSFDGTGVERWFVELGQYEGFTPAVADGKVYAFTGAVSPEIIVIDAATGARVDSITDPGLMAIGWAAGTTPVLGGAHNILASHGGRLLSFDLQTRQLGWQVQGEYAGQVAVANAVVYAQNGTDVEARRESDGSLLWVWHRPDVSQLWPDMIVTRNMLFASDGATTFALDLNAHRQGWSYPAGGELSLSKDGLLLIAGSEGVLTAIKVK